MYLQNKLAEQKETEKQALINKLNNMSGSDLYVFKELQNTGISNWYKESEKFNAEKAEKEEFDNTFEDADVDTVADDTIADNGYYGVDDFNADDAGEDTMDDNDLQPIDDHFEDE